MNGATSIGLASMAAIAVAFVVALSGVGFVLARLYQRATKEISFVRTGFGGQKVILDGGAIILPILHEVIRVNMNTIRLEVQRKEEQSLITKDRMRVDVTAEFYLRVTPTAEGISAAAQTTGEKTREPDELKSLMEGKFVDALRSAAAEMTMRELQDQRANFVQKVHGVVSEELRKNGLELETVSLTSLDQTNKRFFNPENAFDAEGLTRLTQETENRRQERNRIEQDVEVQVREKNLEAERRKLDLEQQTKFAQMQQNTEIASRAAETEAMIAKQQAERKREAETARIESEREIAAREIERERAIEAAKIEKNKLVREKEIEQERSVDIAAIERDKAVKIADQQRAIEIAKQSEAQSVAEAEANKARAEAVKMEQEVITVRSVAAAEMERQVAIVEAKREAERLAVAQIVSAEAQNKAAKEIADALREEAKGKADSEVMLAEANKARLLSEADGTMRLNEARNALSPDQVRMEIKLEIIKTLPALIEASAKPIERISDIKVVEIGGLGGADRSKSADGQPTVSGNLAQSAVDAALRYRVQAPFVDSVLREVGISGGIQGLLSGASLQSVDDIVTTTETPPCQAVEPAATANIEDRQPQQD